MLGERAKDQHGEHRLHADLRDVEGQLHAPLLAMEPQGERRADDGGDDELRRREEEEPQDQRGLAERHGVRVAAGRHVDQQQLAGREEQGEDEETRDVHRVAGGIRRHEREGGREGWRRARPSANRRARPPISALALLPGRLAHLDPSTARVSCHASDRHCEAMDVVGVAGRGPRWGRRSRSGGRSPGRQARRKPKFGIRPPRASHRASRPHGGGRRVRLRR